MQKAIMLSFISSLLVIAMFSCKNQEETQSSKSSQSSPAEEDDLGMGLPPPSEDERNVDLPKDSLIFMVVEDSPQFPGGKDSMKVFIKKNLRYPKRAKRNSIEGTVYLTFVVEKDGSLSNIKILRGIGAGCDEEAMRIVRSMPEWKPGMQRGKPVRVQYNMPVRFRLPE